MTRERQRLPSCSLQHPTLAALFRQSLLVHTLGMQVVPLFAVCGILGDKEENDGREMCVQSLISNRRESTVPSSLLVPNIQLPM